DIKSGTNVQSDASTGTGGKWLVGLVAVVLLAAAVSFVLERPTVRARIVGPSAVPSRLPQAPSDRESTRGQPIIVGDESELDPMQKANLRWMAVPEAPPAGASPRITYADGTPVERGAERERLLRERGVVAREEEPWAWEPLLRSEEYGQPSEETTEESPPRD
ncbi:MAG: hypothetical protein ACE5O2_06685, partial [Armatimonadota bacterium]